MPRIAARANHAFFAASVLALTAMGAGMAANDQIMNEAKADHQRQMEELENRMPLGPLRAKSLGLTPRWQLDAPDPIVQFFPHNAGVFTINQHNELSKISGDKGTLLWHTHGGNSADQIIDVIAIDDIDRILVVRTTSILTISNSTGNPSFIGEARSSLQQLQWLADTTGVVDGPYLIYGGLSGEIVWQGYTHGFTEGAHRIGRRVATPPVISDTLVIAGSASGTIFGLDVKRRSKRWTVSLLAAPTAPLTVHGQLLFVASKDQHLRAINTDTGVVEWARLLESPLQHGPYAAADSVYQQVPDRGLVCLEARPKHAPEGMERWTAPTVTGNVIADKDGMLITWDADKRVMQSVSASTGVVEATAAIPEALNVTADGDLIYILGHSTRLQLLRLGSGD